MPLSTITSSNFIEIQLSVMRSLHIFLFFIVVVQLLQFILKVTWATICMSFILIINISYHTSQLTVLLASYVTLIKLINFLLCFQVVRIVLVSWAITLISHLYLTAIWYHRSRCLVIVDLFLLDWLKLLAILKANWVLLCNLILIRVSLWILLW
jgi:hypothetical protein